MHYRELDTPALFVDLDVLGRNLDTMARYCEKHTLGLRPHTKTHKMLEVARMQLAHGAIGLTVAKVGEAEVMSASGATEILIAYPVFGEKKSERLARLAGERKILVSIDSEVTARGLSKVLSHQGVSLGVLVEVDVGVGRCGLPPGPKAVALAREIGRLPGLEFRGLMTFFGSVWGSLEEREKALGEVTLQLEQACEAFRREKIPLEIVSGGSTPSAPLTHGVKDLTEIRPGTYVFNDMNTYHQGSCRLNDCAARVVATVVSTAVPGQVILDAGSKTLTSDPLGAGPATGHGLVVEAPHSQLFKLNEEHGYLRLSPKDPAFKVGDTVTVIPNHVCPCVNLHDEVFTVRNEEVVGSWQVAARGKVR